MSSTEPRPAMARPGLVVPDVLRAKYAAWRWTQVSDYAEQSTWQLDCPGRSTVFLKVAQSGAFPGVPAEIARTRWATDHLPVPEVIDTGTDEAFDWLITAGLAGRPASDPATGEAREVVVALAEGLRRFHESAPVAACPFDFRAAPAMAHARRRAAAGQIDPAEDFDEEHRHLDLPAALRELERLRPADEDLVVCHGDYCPPNALLSEGRVVGFLDLGELGVADRWWDLGVATRAVTRNYTPGLESLFLAAYGAPADPQRQAFYRLLYDIAS